jgi:hypothetical protein
MFHVYDTTGNEIVQKFRVPSGLTYYIEDLKVDYSEEAEETSVLLIDISNKRSILKLTWG